MKFSPIWLWNPFTLCLLMLACFEGVSRYFDYHEKVPTADRTLRNPFRPISYPEYLAGDGVKPGEPLVTVISNSQGWGNGVDAEDTWFCDFRDSIGQDRISDRVENWSCPALDLSTLELLSIKAINRKATFVVMVMSYYSMSPTDHWGLGRYDNDVALIVGEPESWIAWRNALTASHASTDKLLHQCFRMNSSLVRSRRFAHVLLASRLPVECHHYVFGRDYLRGHIPKRAIAKSKLKTLMPQQPQIESRLLQLDRLRAKWKLAEGHRFRAEEYLKRRPALIAKRVEENYRPAEERGEVFRQAYLKFDERFKEAGIPYLWIWMPFKEGSHNWRYQKEFLELIGPISKEIGASTLDFTDSIESDRFIDSSHFNEKGHQEFGKLMMEAIRNELR
ncbi:MAG: hypothetical protein CMJ77_12905 [Planctomycetaceae bacterium]|nr:hypothetical protein [Planctomycetaceae bacterium]